MNKAVGYFKDYSNIPVYDPGIEVDCLVCLNKLSKPIKTISLCKLGDNVSYFFRVHKDCWSSLTELEKTEVESVIIDTEDSK